MEEENDDEYLDETFKPKKRIDDRPLPWYTIFIVFGVGIILISYIHHQNSILPIPLTIEGEGSNIGKFIAERAHNHVLQISTIGPRVTGSYQNEISMAAFLTREIGFILQSAGPDHKIHSRVQKPSKCFNAHSVDSPGFTNCYTDIQNIVVKLSTSTSQTASDEDSLFGKEKPIPSNDVLISCHFDSSAQSPGIGSSGFHCAVMLELLRVLSHSTDNFKNGIIFLFNGAKESGMQGAHGFITQHEWAKDVKVFLNLDGFGSGGKEVLFQLGMEYPALLEVYGHSVPHPSAQVLVDILSMYLTDEDTDFHIFSSVAKKSGLGFANFHNGYVYQTTNDVSHLIPLGSYQHTGDNLLALVKQIVTGEDLSGSLSHSTGQPVYFDVFGKFMVSYSECTTVAVNAITVIFSIVTITRHVGYLKTCLGEVAQRTHLRLTLEFAIIGHLMVLVCTTLLAGLLDLASISMSWYTRQWLVFPLYLGLVLMGHILIGRLVEKRRGPQISRLISAQMSIFAAQIIMTGILFISTFLGLRISYMFVLLILFPTSTMYSMTCCELHKNSRSFLVAYLISMIFPVVLIISHADIMLSVLIPFYGRSDCVKLCPDKAIALFMTFFGGMIVSYLAPLIILVRYAGRVLTWLIAVPLFILILVRLTPFGFPYGSDSRAPTQQRITVLHTERTLYTGLDKIRRHESGFWIVPHDLNAHVTLAAMRLNVTQLVDINKDCKQHDYCSLPVFDLKRLDSVGSSYWIAAPGPIIHSPISIEVTTRKMSSTIIRKLSFIVRGPDHMVLLISPHSGFKLLFWSFMDQIPTPTVSHGNQREVYGVTLGRGMEDQPWLFWLAFEIPMGNLSASATDLALIGHYMHPEQQTADHVQQFRGKFPKWTNLQMWTSSYKAWVV